MIRFCNKLMLADACNWNIVYPMSEERITIEILKFCQNYVTINQSFTHNYFLDIQEY
jgi:hypothetical protein